MESNGFPKYLNMYNYLLKYNSENCISWTLLSHSQKFSHVQSNDENILIVLDKKLPKASRTQFLNNLQNSVLEVSEEFPEFLTYGPCLMGYQG